MNGKENFYVEDNYMDYSHLGCYFIGSRNYKRGNCWMAPFIADYKIQLRERPVVTLAVTVIVLFILFKLLF